MLQAELEAHTFSGQKSEYGRRLFEEMESDVFPQSKLDFPRSGIMKEVAGDPAASKLTRALPALLT